MKSESALAGPRRRRPVGTATIAIGLSVTPGLLGFLWGTGLSGPREVQLAQGAPPSTTTSTAPAGPTTPETVPTTTTTSNPDPPPSTPDPAPSAAGPTTTVTTAQPARSAPKATTTTTAVGTIQSRGAAALALIDYPWQRTGYSIVFTGPNDNLLGLTEPSGKRITIYLRPTQSTSEVARIIAHEIGHAVDFTMTTDTERADYRRIRGIDGRSWFPGCQGCADYGSPVGDFAETFAYWLLGNGSFNSQLAGKPTAAQLAALTPIFTADAAPVPSTTTTTRPLSPPPIPKTTTTTTPVSGGPNTPVYTYGGGRRTSPWAYWGRTRRG